MPWTITGRTEGVVIPYFVIPPQVATPVNWSPGSAVMVVPSLSEEEAKTMFPKHTKHDLPSGKPYLRTTML